MRIVINIIGILATIPLHFYGNYALQANRTDARAALSETATSLEKCRRLYSTYNHTNCNVTFPVTSESGYYSVKTAFASPTEFTLTVAPIDGQPQANDAECKALTLTNTGAKNATGTTPAECW